MANEARSLNALCRRAHLAKVNLTLEVIGRLPNGYHAIRSVMVRLAHLADIVRVERAGPAGAASPPELGGDSRRRDQHCHAARRAIISSAARRQYRVDIANHTGRG